ncbi:transcriptional regulator [Enterovibrio norvegicus]|uniref:Transcriptional regulator n=1 Tax=Enterovibrio norvegicus TaxID=188144 RepID=A0A2N7L5N0_9GAMM|nr:winged helix-turn-helix domain-containing protein [Enterovibrio norvegicus]PMN88879.1 transcriptional regulator [Enterovibrio norvegicus]
MLNKSNRYLLGERFVFSPSDSSVIDLHEADELIRLGSNEARVLMVLIEEPHAIVTRHRIHDYVWRKQGFEVDDSSLTQSISTLRRALKDSTKSPMFVKTVPKRGYQVVCSVEAYNDQDVDIPSPPVMDPTPIQQDDVTSSDAPASDQSTQSPAAPVDTLNVEPASVPSGAATNPAIDGPVYTSTKMPLGSWFALILAFLVPLIFYATSTPKSEAFKAFFQVQDVSVYIPINNARIEKWQPMIERCVVKYMDYYGSSRSLSEVIVTGGQDNQISLNYIHFDKDTDDNLTYVLLTSQEESHSLCR